MINIIDIYHIDRLCRKREGVFVKKNKVPPLFEEGRNIYYVTTINNIMLGGISIILMS